MKCYKCDSTKELSAKKIDRHGNITFICKFCRNLAYKKTSKPVDTFVEAFDKKAWAIMAKENHAKLAAKYRDEDFMRAKGLI